MPAFAAHRAVTNSPEFPRNLAAQAVSQHVVVFPGMVMGWHGTVKVADLAPIRANRPLKARPFLLLNGRALEQPANSRRVALEMFAQLLQTPALHIPVIDVLPASAHQHLAGMRREQTYGVIYRDLLFHSI
jgi:hypothetical protein